MPGSAPQALPPQGPRDPSSWGPPPPGPPAAEVPAHPSQGAPSRTAGPAGSLVMSGQGPWGQSLTRDLRGLGVQRADQQAKLRLTNLKPAQSGPLRKSPSGPGKGVAGQARAPPCHSAWCPALSRQSTALSRMFSDQLGGCGSVVPPSCLWSECRRPDCLFSQGRWS